MFFNGLVTDRDYKSTLVCCRKAEAFLYNMLLDGDVIAWRHPSRAANTRAKLAVKSTENNVDDFIWGRKHEFKKTLQSDREKRHDLYDGSGQACAQARLGSCAG